MAIHLPSRPRIGAAAASGTQAKARSRGQALVEFALVVPIFLLLLWGTIDFGFALSSSITVANAAREGARLGTTTLDSTKITNKVLASAPSLNPSDITVTVTCRRFNVGTSTWDLCTGLFSAGAIANGKTDDNVIVNVVYQYHTMTPMTLGATIPVTTTEQMRIE